ERVGIVGIEAVIASDDLVYFLPSGFVQVARLGLIVDDRDDVGVNSNVGEPEIFTHRAEGHEALQILVEIVSVTDALQRTNDRKAYAVEKDGAADGGTAQEKRAPGFIADHDHGTFLLIVHLVDPAPFLHW